MFKPILLSCLLSFAHLAPNCQAATIAPQNAVYQPIEPKTISKKKLAIRKKIQQKLNDPINSYQIMGIVVGLTTIGLGIWLGIRLRLWLMVVLGAILLAVSIVMICLTL